jgi:hypothetical protein
MTKNGLIDFILVHGSPTQRYIVRRDVLSANIHSSEMTRLQEQILQLKETRKLLSKQNESGWFGVCLHGGHGVNAGMDGVVDALVNLGVEPYHDFMQKAKRALLADDNPNLMPAEAKAGWEPVDIYCQPRAVTLARLYNNDEHDVLLGRFQNDLIGKFAEFIYIDSLDDITRELTAKRFTQKTGWKWHPDTEARGYLKGKSGIFPWLTDIYVLGSCLNWKTSQTERIITESMLHVSEFAPVPYIFYQSGGHWNSPGGTYEFLDNPLCCPQLLQFADWWLRDYLYLCKICDAEQIQHYYRNVEWLAENIADDSFYEVLPEGIQKAVEKIEFYYMVLLILHYAVV